MSGDMGPCESAAFELCPRRTAALPWTRRTACRPFVFYIPGFCRKGGSRKILFFLEGVLPSALKKGRFFLTLPFFPCRRHILFSGKGGSPPFPASSADGCGQGPHNGSRDLSLAGSPAGTGAPGGKLKLKGCPAGYLRQKPAFNKLLFLNLRESRVWRCGSPWGHYD